MNIQSDNKSILKNKIINKLGIKKLPNDIKISNITICCKLDIEFKINDIAKDINLNENSIVSIAYGNDDSTNRTLKEKKNKLLNKKKGFSNFYNQVSLKIMVESKKEKPLNIKLFKNGSIQMTGCNSVDNIVEGFDK